MAFGDWLFSRASLPHCSGLAWRQRMALYFWICCGHFELGGESYGSLGVLNISWPCNKKAKEIWHDITLSAKTSKLYFFYCKSYIADIIYYWVTNVRYYQRLATLKYNYKVYHSAISMRFIYELPPWHLKLTDVTVIKTALIIM